MAHSYKPADASTCLSSKQVVFIGDSVTRQLFFQFANLVDQKLPAAPPDDQSKHQDYNLTSSNRISLSFYWDPYMNASYSQFVHSSGGDRVASSSDRPAILVLGTGLWYLRYSDTSGGLPAWASRIGSVLDVLKHANPKPADEIVFLPIEDPVTSKLSPERASSIHPSDVDAMNSDLYHRIYPSFQEPNGVPPLHTTTIPISLPLVFNRMLDDSQTEDGLHFSDAVVKAQANVLLNLHCNDKFPKRFPMDKTCCRSYPWPSAVHTLVYVALVAWGPGIWLYSRLRGKLILLIKELQVHLKTLGGNNPAAWVNDEQKPPLIVSGAMALMFTADRTGFWLKEQKEFSSWYFSAFSLFSLAVGLLTVKKGDKDLGFLNRDQTDEWKGWMQSAY